LDRSACANSTLKFSFNKHVPAEERQPDARRAALQGFAYGDVSKKTGEFIKTGNIIQEYPELKDMLGEGTPSPEDRKYLFASRSEGTARSFDVGV
jgi:hypothetical protein